MHTRLLSALATVLLSRAALGQGEVPPPPAPAPTASAPAPAPTAEASASAPAPAPTGAPEAAAPASPSATSDVPTVPPGEDTSPSQAAPTAEVQALRGPLLLQVEGFEDPAAIEELRAALSAEFGCLVILRPEDARFAPQGRLVVARHPETNELAITFVDAAEQSSTRVVQEPADPAERARTVTLLAGTLARSPLEEVEPAAVEGAGAEAEAIPPPPTHAAVASLFYPLATNFDVPDVHTYFAFSLLYGRIGSLDGLGLGTLQFASRGVQGAQIAFLGNAAGGPVAGVQAAFGVNSARALGGLQLAAINHVADEASGAQLGFVNYAGGKVTGAQGGFSVNIGGDVEGGQVGLVNVAKNVRGIQVGIFNIADDVDGVPIGLISVTKKGGVHPMAWYSNLTPFNAGLRFATEYTYTILQASYDVMDDMVGPGFGIGGSVPIFLENLYVDIELSETYLFSDGRDADEGKSLTRLRGAVRYQIFPHLSVFAGGGYAGKVEPTREPDGTLGSHYYESRGEFVAGIGL
jgi:hypothetical protein